MSVCIFIWIKVSTKFALLHLLMATESVQFPCRSILSFNMLSAIKRTKNQTHSFCTKKFDITSTIEVVAEINLGTMESAQNVR